MKWVRDQSLTLALLAIFALSLIGQMAAGMSAENEERAAHGLAAIALPAYLLSGRFLSALFENWESEFLQMSAYVLFTAYLFQRGSSESRDPDQDEAEAPLTGNSPWPARQGGLIRQLYSHSLSLALFLLFLVSFVLHWLNSARASAEEASIHGEPATPLLAYLGNSQLWFESFQNWQSEFLSTAVLILLSIWLREDRSPESKDTNEPNASTG